MSTLMARSSTLRSGPCVLVCTHAMRPVRVCSHYEETHVSDHRALVGLGGGHPVVNPVGEFAVNDDWSFVKILEALSGDGRMIATGWGHGGPSAIVHVLWGGLFAKLAGLSLTTLRISVLVAAVLGSLGLLGLFRSVGASPALSLLGTLAIVVNPLFMSQSFTFMTDITFATLVIFSVLLLHLGVQNTRTSLVVAGLFVGLLATLTRQIGVVIPVAFAIMSAMNPAGKRIGRAKAVAFGCRNRLWPLGCSTRCSSRVWGARRWSSMNGS